MPKNKVQKQDILKLLEGIHENFMISRSTVFGHYNVSLIEAANLIIDSNCYRKTNMSGFRQIRMY